MQPLVNLPQRGAGEVASGVLMRLVSLWWEFPPRLNSNIRILRFGMQQFFVGSMYFFKKPEICHCFNQIDRDDNEGRSARSVRFLATAIVIEVAIPKVGSKAATWLSNSIRMAYYSKDESAPHSGH